MKLSRRFSTIVLFVMVSLSFCQITHAAITDGNANDTVGSQIGISGDRSVLLAASGEDPVGRWMLDEGTGSIANDISVGNNDGAIVGASWSANDLVFDGSGDYVQITGYKGITGTTARTVEAYIKTSSEGVIVSWGHPTNDGERWVLKLDSSGRLCVDIGNAYIVGTTVLTDNGLHHVMAKQVDTASPTIQSIELFVDGEVEIISEIYDAGGSSLGAGVVACWPFNGNANDTSGNGYNGTLVNAPGYTAGKLGQAIDLNQPSDQYIDVATASAYQVPWTVSVWVRRHSNLWATGLVDGYDASDGDKWYGLRLQQYNKTYKVGYSNYVTNINSYWDYSAPLDTWVHLVFVGTSAVITLYADAESKILEVGGQSQPVCFDRIGKTHGYNCPVDADLDELTIWNRALSSTEVSSLYNGGAGVAVTSGSSPIALNTASSQDVMIGRFNGGGDFNGIIADVCIYDRELVEGLSDLPLLHSNPSAPVAIFMDFHYESRDGEMLPFDWDGDPDTYNAQEMDDITFCWSKVANAFAPFDTDVTTEMPPAEQPFIWAAIYRLPTGPGSGGGARTFGYMDLADYFVYRYDEVAGRIEDGLRPQNYNRQGSVRTGVVIHETGHSHGVTGHETSDENGNSKGIDTISIERGPFTRSVGNIGGWHNFTSEYIYLGNPQGLYWPMDDIDRITSVIIEDVQHYLDPGYSGDGFRPDDHGNNIAGATAMAFDAPSNTFVASGIVERYSDKDFLSFACPGGNVWIGANTYLPTSLLDVKLTLYDGAGILISHADHADSLAAAMRVDGLAAGAYYVEVSCDGDYSELGMYDLTVGTDLPSFFEPLVHLLLNNNTDDASIYDNDATKGSLATWDTGPSGSGAIRLHGNSSEDDGVYILVTDYDFNGITKSLPAFGRTIALWFKADNVSGGKQVLLDGIENNSPAGYSIYIEGGQLKAYGDDSDGLTHWTGTSLGPASVSSGQWHHVAVTHRCTFTDVDNTFAMYLDGVEVSRSVGGALPGWSNGQEIGIGHSHGNTYFPDTGLQSGVGFSGVIDDVRIYNNVLPRHLIAELADNTDQSQVAPTGSALNMAAVPSYNSVGLSWDSASGATGYKVLRAEDNQHFATRATLGSGTLAYTDNGLYGSKQYFYRIETLNTSQVGQAEVITRAMPVRNLTFTRVLKDPEPDWDWVEPSWGHNAEGRYGIVLKWFEPDGHRDTQLRIERSDNNGASFQTINTIDSKERLYEDRLLSPSKSYVYRVVTVDDQGDAASATINASTAFLSQVVASPISSGQVTLSWENWADSDGYEIERRLSTDDSGDWTMIAPSIPAGQSNYDDMTVSSGNTYLYRINAYNTYEGGLVNKTELHGVDVAAIVTPGPQILPAGWGVTGDWTSSASESSGTFTINGGGGAYVQSSTDSPGFVYQWVSGNMEIVARVTGVNGSVGVMARDWRRSDALRVAAGIDSSNRTFFSSRDTTDASSSTQYPYSGITAPRWIKLVRAGDIFSAYHSTDGSSWSLIAQQTVVMDRDLLVGLGVWAESSGSKTGTFDNVSITEDTMAGDVNLDGFVNLIDFAKVGIRWLDSPCNEGNGWCNGADLSGNGTVDIADIRKLSENWLFDRNLMLHLKLDETAGTTASDSSDNGRDGTLTNMDDTDWVEGKAGNGNALEFDGVNDFVDVEGWKGILGGQSRTVCAWIKTSTAVGANIVFWGDPRTNHNRWSFYARGGGELAVGISLGFVIGTTNVCDGQWHHVAAVFANDGTPDIAETRLYVDGVEETISASMSAVPNTLSYLDVLIGSNGPTSFNGLIDEVHIYDRPLTAEEIAALAQ